MILDVFLVAAVLLIFMMNGIAKKSIRELDELKAVDIAKVADGIYRGNYDTVLVKVTLEASVENHKLMDIKIIRHENGKGKKAEAIVKQMIAENSTEADVIAGATMSSKVIRAALIDALKEGTEQK